MNSYWLYGAWVVVLPLWVRYVIGVTEGPGQHEGGMTMKEMLDSMIVVYHTTPVSWWPITALIHLSLIVCYLLFKYWWVLVTVLLIVALFKRSKEK